MKKKIVLFLVKLYINIFGLTRAYNDLKFFETKYWIFKPNSKLLIHKIMQLVFKGIQRIFRKVKKFFFLAFISFMSITLFVVTLIGVTPVIAWVGNTIRKLNKTRAEEREEQLGIQRHKAERHYSIEQLKEILKLKGEEKRQHNSYVSQMLKKFDLKVGKYILRIKSNYHELYKVKYIKFIEDNIIEITLVKKNKPNKYSKSLDENIIEIQEDIYKRIKKLSDKKKFEDLSKINWNKKKQLIIDFLSDYVILKTEDFIANLPKIKKDILTPEQIKETIRLLRLQETMGDNFTSFKSNGKS